MQFKSDCQGRLRTSIMHQGSGDTLLTDAPKDNKGQGETFSPTDQVAAALGSCIATIMGIEADKMNVKLNGLTWETTKEMQIHPRTIGKTKVHFSWKNCEISFKQRILLKNKGLACPVMLALSPNIIQEITFAF
ncbi:OsmC family protein [Cyclobacteriaceae bacterium]|nr:OsmC family protein [Cyclobacteriaceae bacterium]